MEEPLAGQKMMRSEALKCRRATQSLIDHQQFVQQRGATAPMADDKQRWCVDLGLFQLATKQQPVDERERDIDKRRDADCYHHPKPAWSNTKATEPQEVPPSARHHAVPKPGE